MFDRVLNVPLGPKSKMINFIGASKRHQWDIIALQQCITLKWVISLRDDGHPRARCGNFRVKLLFNVVRSLLTTSINQVSYVNNFNVNYVHSKHIIT